VLPDPKPEIFVRQSDGKSSVTKGYSNGPDLLTISVADLLELQRRVLGIGFQQTKLLICTRANGLWQRLIVVPEVSIRTMSGFAGQFARSKGTRASITVVGERTGDSVVDPSGVKVFLEPDIDWAVLVHPCVQLMQGVGREGADGAFDFDEGCHGV